MKERFWEKENVMSLVQNQNKYVYKENMHRRFGSNFCDLFPQ